MKLFGCTMVKNEEGMIPYVMPYVERLGYDKFVVYDDSSTDNTVAELSKYPFVEIRRIEPSKDIIEVDIKKSQLQADFFTECWDYIMDNNGEDVWMTFTDFDEVLFCSGRNSFKEEIAAYDYCYNKIYFNKPLVQIIEKKRGEEDKSILIHSSKNIVVNKWNSLWSMKVILLKVNAIERVICYRGNHMIGIKLKKKI